MSPFYKIEGTMSFITITKTSNINLTLIVAGAVLCLISYILRLVTHISIYKRRTEIIPFHVTLVFTFLGYFGWGYWSGNDPVKMNIPYSFSVPIGIALAGAGLGLFLYSEIKKHGVGQEGTLVKTGIYSKIRHPMYIGLVLLHIGVPFIFKSFIACISVIVWASFIATWTRFEDKNLEQKYGRKYIEYKQRTWF
jgi:protein-S-isoprenylcysteine O-methyltransferase Ste14